MKKYFSIIMYVVVAYAYPIEIIPLAIEHVPQVKKIILDCALELSIFPYCSEEQIKEGIDQEDEINNPAYKYPEGIFLLIYDDNTLIGMGGVKRIDELSCELKKIILVVSKRNKGYASQLLALLIDHAQKMGYQKIRLEVPNPTTQRAAIAFYKKLGFYQIPSYRQEYSYYSMEKIIA